MIYEAYNVLSLWCLWLTDIRTLAYALEWIQLHSKPQSWRKLSSHGLTLSDSSQKALWSQITINGKETYWPINRLRIINYNYWNNSFYLFYNYVSYYFMIFLQIPKCFSFGPSSAGLAWFGYVCRDFCLHIFYNP